MKNKLLLAVLVFLLLLVGVFLLFFFKNNEASKLEDSIYTAAEIANLENKENDLSNDSIIDIGDITSAQSMIPGGNKITNNNVVISDTGMPVNIGVMPNDENAPKAVVIKNVKNLSEEVIRINIKNNKFEPESFQVQAGQAVSLAFSADNNVHVIVFDNNSLAALSMAVSPNQTKSKTFNAPLEPGRYEFRCDVPGHLDLGEIGYMIVE